MDNSIEEHFVDYISTIYNGILPERQHKEIKRAFFGGAISVLSIMVKTANDETSLEKGAEILEAIRQECMGFAKSQKIKKE